MPRLRANNLLAPLAALLLAACGADGGAADEAEAQGPRERLGLFTTLPIYWNEQQDIAAMLEPEAQEPSWVRAALEERHELVPLDTLEDGTISGLDTLLIAQPRALSAAENVALDDWVRGGGRALVLADPFLTQHSDFALGDPRRPFDVVLISPILARWGLALEFDDAQGEDERVITIGDVAVPVRLAGRFVAAQSGEDAECAFAGEGLLADCSVGEGRVLLLADAAILDTESDDANRRAAVESLLARLRSR